MYKPIMIRALEKKFIKKIDCGDFHSLALDNNGEIYSWGSGKYGECGNGKFADVEVPTKIKYFEGKKFVNIVAGNHHSLALTSQNELYGWG
jgi:alpha-tubulin suppressor-like RCC1 family protein